jgi:hypothetical protein
LTVGRILHRATQSDAADGLIRTLSRREPAWRGIWAADFFYLHSNSGIDRRNFRNPDHLLVGSSFVGSVRN